MASHQTEDHRNAEDNSFDECSLKVLFESIISS